MLSACLLHKSVLLLDNEQQLWIAILLCCCVHNLLCLLRFCGNVRVADFDDCLEVLGPAQASDSKPQQDTRNERPLDFY